MTVSASSAFPHELLAALVWLRFGCDDEAARAAWTRMLQNHGWDADEHGRAIWREHVDTGLGLLRVCGFVDLTKLLTDDNDNGNND